MKKQNKKLKFLRKRVWGRKTKSPINAVIEVERLFQTQYKISRLLHFFAAEGRPLHTAEGQKNQGDNRQLEGKKPGWFNHRINLIAVAHNLLGAESLMPCCWAGSRPPPDLQGEVSPVYAPPPGRTWPVQRKGSEKLAEHQLRCREAGIRKIKESKRSSPEVNVLIKKQKFHSF